MGKKICLLSIICGLVLLTGCGNSSNNNTGEGNQDNSEKRNMLICNNRADAGHYKPVEFFIEYDANNENILSFRMDWLLYEATDEQLQQIYDQGYTDEDIDKEFNSEFIEKAVEQNCNGENEKKYYSVCEGKVLNHRKAILRQEYSKSGIQKMFEESEEKMTKQKMKELLESGKFDDGFKGTFTCEK